MPPLKKFYFNIHGLPIEIDTSHSLFSQMVLADLRHFQVHKALSSKRLIQFRLDSFDQKKSYPEMGSYRFHSSGDSTLRYGKCLIAVANNHQGRRVQVSVDPNASIFPDPAYHYCITQPLSLWLKEMGLFFLHASCIALEGQGALIIGSSRAGKSTLALSAVKHGFQFLSDEQPLLSLSSSGPRVLAFNRRIRLDRSNAVLFNELQVYLKAQPQERLLFPIEKIWPQSVKTLSCRPRLLVFPKFITKGTYRLTKLHPTQALDMLFKDEYFVWYKDKPWDKISHQHLALLSTLASQTKAISLEYREKDILKIPSMLERLLRE